jgi:hypothetical protein
LKERGNKRTGVTDMKKASLLIVGVLAFSLALWPTLAGAHYRGGTYWSFGTAFIFAPRPVYIAPPVYVAPPVSAFPPPVVYAPVPTSPAPPASGYNQSPPPDVSAGPPPAAQNKCREWKMIERRFEDRFDSYNGKWQLVPVEKWGWVDVPCNP